ncbi:MATE efflux family protein [Eubacterium saphenum ATCC 49989]|nr:MATE efflux family protein [Eubacterium saphenum ATCC 49989]
MLVMDSQIRQELLTKSPVRLMFQLGIPGIVGMVVIGLYPFMDGVFAGNIIGQSAMAACSVAMPLTLVNNGISTLLGVGSASILSRALGKGDKKTVDQIMGNLIFWVLVLSTTVMILGILFAPQFLDLVGATGEIKELGVRYLRVLFLGSIFVNFAQSSNMVIRGEGHLKIAMGIMGAGAVLNIILDPIFMYAMGSRGIEGAAIATVLSQLITAVVSIYYFKKKSKVVKINHIAMKKDIFGEMFAVGFSAMMMQVMTLIQQSLMYKMSFKYGGTDNGILMAAALRIFAFSFIPLWGLSQGMQPVIGTNYGAKIYSRVKAGLKVFNWGALVLAGLFYLPIMLFPRQILHMFGVENDILTAGIPHFRMLYSIFIVYGFMIISVVFFQSIGDAKKAGILVIFRQLVVFVPSIIILPRAFGIDAVWYTQPLVDFIMTAISAVLIVLTVKRFPHKDAETIQSSLNKL